MGLVGWGFVGWGDGGRQNVRDSHSRGSVALADDGLEVGAEVSLQAAVADRALAWAGACRKYIWFSELISYQGGTPPARTHCWRPRYTQNDAILERAESHPRHAVMTDVGGGAGGGGTFWRGIPLPRIIWLEAARASPVNSFSGIFKHTHTHTTHTPHTTHTHKHTPHTHTRGLAHSAHVGSA